MSNNEKQLIIEEYDKKVHLYHKLEKKVKDLLDDVLGKVKIHSITERIKTKDSLIKKIETKDKYKTLNDITDILGLRIITYFSDDVDEVAEIIEKEFKIDVQKSVDKRKALEPDRFGYLSLHYIASLSEERLKLTEYQEYSDYCFEIQIRSLLQHAWAEIEHDIGYKSSAAVPHEIKRNFSRLAGLLELADEEFKRIRIDIEKYTEKVQLNISEQTLDQVVVDLESVKQFLINDSLVKEVSTRIAQGKNWHLDDAFPPESDLVEKLKATGFNSLGDIKRDLEKYKEQVVNFTLKWITSTSPSGFFTSQSTLIFLCYIKLSLLEDVNKIANCLKKFQFSWIVTEQEAVELAQKIVEVSRSTNKT